MHTGALSPAQCISLALMMLSSTFASGGCGSAPYLGPPMGAEGDRFQVEIVEPADGDEVVVSKPFRCVVRVTNLASGGPPTSVGVLMKQRRIAYGSAFLELVPDQAAGGSSKYLYSGEFDVSGAAPKGRCSIQSEAVSMRVIPPAKEGELDTFETTKFESKSISVKAVMDRSR